MDTLSAGRDLKSVEQKVKTQCIGCILRVIHRVKRSFLGWIMCDEHKIRTAFFFIIFSDQRFLFRFKIIRVTDLSAILFGNFLFCLIKTHRRNLIHIRKRDV